MPPRPVRCASLKSKYARLCLSCQRLDKQKCCMSALQHSGRAGCLAQPHHVPTRLDLSWWKPTNLPRSCHKACDSSKGIGRVLQSTAMRRPQITSSGKVHKSVHMQAQWEQAPLELAGFQEAAHPLPIIAEAEASQQAYVSRRASACPQHSSTTGLALSPTHQMGSTLRLPASMFSLMVRSTFTQLQTITV